MFRRVLCSTQRKTEHNQTQNAAVSLEVSKLYSVCSSVYTYLLVYVTEYRIRIFWILGWQNTLRWAAVCSADAVCRAAVYSGLERRLNAEHG